MARSVVDLVFVVGVSASFAFAACNPPSRLAGDGGASSGNGAVDDNGGPSNGDGGRDGGQDEPVDPGPPAVLYVGRFVHEDKGQVTAWPGARIIARFDGTSATATLTQTPASSGGPSWVTPFVDGVAGQPFAVNGESEEHFVGEELPPGIHTIELEKRTEANLGTLRFEGFKFAGGAGLLPPPPRPAHRIEFVADSTIDGFGVEGVMNGDGSTCLGGAPAQYNNAGKSTAAFTAAALSAEHFLIAYSGKGLTINEDPTDNDTFGILYGRTLPESKTPAWDFATWRPDVVVISLGGTDLDGLSTAPPAFLPAYDALVGNVRTNYPNAYVFCAVWSQITDQDPADTRSAMAGVLSTIVNRRKDEGDERIFFFEFPEANGAVDGTGCFSHANAAHHANMAKLLATEIKTRTGW